MKTVAFVCTANICRSPMAAAILRDRLASAGLTDQVRVVSAGVWADSGRAASAHAANVLKSRGIELRDHRSQPLTAQLLKQADIILVMEESHRRSIFYMAPEHLAKVYLLAELAGKHEDIADPFGGALADYEETADLLQARIDQGLPNLLRRLQVKP